MIVAAIRTVLLYFIVILVMRVMGKRQIGELQPFELVVTLMLSDLATIPMQETGVPLLAGIVPIFILAALEILLSYLSLKSKRARAFLLGRPSILIRNGVLDEKEMRQLRVNLDDILDELRKKDIASVDEVAIAIVETDGSISAFPKSDGSTVPYTLISDGRIISENLKKCNISEKKLREMLGSKKPEDIFLATYTKKDGISVQEKKKEG